MVSKRNVQNLLPWHTLPQNKKEKKVGHREKRLQGCKSLNLIGRTVLSSPAALQCFQVALRMLDACWGAAAELQKEDFDRQIFQQLRDETPDVNNHPVSAAAPDLRVALDFVTSLRQK